MKVIVKRWADVDGSADASPGSAALNLASAEGEATTVILLGAPKGAIHSDRKGGADGWFHVGIAVEADEIAFESV